MIYKNTSKRSMRLEVYPDPVSPRNLNQLNFFLLKKKKLILFPKILLVVKIGFLHKFECLTSKI
uniref:Uncharacterized protein n=1 Tax=Glycine max TaxID=3847 RepID=K7LFZ4_SOYBN